MDNSMRYSFNSFRSSHVADKQNKEPLRCSQVSNYKPIDLTRSFVHSNDSKNGNSSNKLNYKYKRFNNSFRLVNCDRDDEESRQNYAENQQKNKNSHILLALNSLSQRVEKLEKMRDYEEHKQNFNIHLAVEKIISENKQAGYLKMQILEKKLEKAVSEIDLVKEKISSFSKLPTFFAECEQNIMKKCKIVIEEVTNKQNLSYKAQISQKLSKIQKEMSKHQESQKSLRLLQSQMQKQINKLQKDFQNQIQTFEKQKGVTNEKIKSILEQHQKFSVEIKDCQQNLIKSSELSSTRHENKKCNDKIIGNLLLEFILKSIDNVEKQKESVTYGIDKQGYIVDSQGFYLIDNRGYILKLTSTQVSKLVEANLIQKS